MTRFYERHYRQSLEGFRAAFRRRAAAEDPVSTHAFTADEQATLYFRDVMRPLDAYHVMYGVLANGKRAFAQLSLYRGSLGPAFGKVACDKLRQLLRYVSVGLSRVPKRLLCRRPRWCWRSNWAL